MSIVRFCLFVLIAVTVCGPARSRDNPIVIRMAAFTEAYNAKDAEAISGFYTEKGALLPPQGKALIGRSPILAHYANAFANGVAGLKYRILEIDQTSEDTAIEIGETLVVFKSQTITGRSMHIWKKVDGEWYLHRDMFHVLVMSK